MNFKFYLSTLVLVVLVLSSSALSAQQCNSSDIPFTYTVIPNPGGGGCFLQINWNGAMPELECATNTPGAGSTIPANRRLTLLDVTINGTVYPLYDWSGSGCNIDNIEYGIEPNSYITTILNTDFCDVIGESTIAIYGNQSGASSFNCSLANSDVAAPAELTYFKGMAMDRANRLDWATSSEENVSSFEIEKSPDGKRNIETLGAITATGFSESMKYYSMEDDSPRPLTYYRLRTIDFDGSFATSEWVVVQRRTNQKENLVQVSPVPYKGEEALQLYYQSDVSEAVVISISDINGRLLWEERKEIDAGVYNWSFDLPNFKQHLIVLRINNRAGVISRLIPYESNY